MSGFFWILWVVVIIAIAIWAFGGTRRRRLNALQRAAAIGEFSPEERAQISKHVEIADRLPGDLRTEVERLALVLIEEKNFEACGGLAEVTREMKLVIMFQAALLLVGRSHRFYSQLRSVLLYPDAYHGKDEDGDNEEDGVRLGESWHSGSVVLSWRSVCKGGENEEDGHNVVLHEFAHQLDQENGKSDGLPILEKRNTLGSWAHTFSDAYEKFCDDLNDGRKTVMDPYGGTNPAEFFAVATETFFEKPHQLHEDSPELFAQLQTYYGLDPLSW